MVICVDVSNLDKILCVLFTQACITISLLDRAEYDNDNWWAWVCAGLADCDCELNCKTGRKGRRERDTNLNVDVKCMLLISYE